ncbi:MAG: hypothetical protein HY815_15115 [Candidatus Riflebacteria bacterium]|nr:hypothetical protein [Candidatus Riflebacteria bacterium]
MRVVWCFVPLALSFILIMTLEDKMNGWFAPFAVPTPKPAGTARGPSAATAAQSPVQDVRTPWTRTTYRVLIDPGHGGRAERRSATTGDNWDQGLLEFMLLDKTANESSWPEFEATVRRYQELSKSPVRRIRLSASLSRENSFLDHPDAMDRNINKHFRLFDSPDSFPATATTPLFPGRMSKVNAVSADLVLGVHINSSAAASARGPTALFVPPFAFYEEIRQMAIGVKPWKDLRQSPYYQCWSPARGGGDRRGEIVGELTRYYLDSVAGASAEARRSRVLGRRNHVMWSYRDTAPASISNLGDRLAGPYWERERSAFEAFRRAGGPEEMGGDNLYAGQELTRFMRYALWKDRSEGGNRLPPDTAQYGGADGFRPRPPARKAHPSDSAAERTRPTTSGAGSPDDYLGRHQMPLASDWALPLYTNAVVAYLEAAYLSNPADLWLLDNKLDVMAEGVAVGIYSLCAGLKVKPVPAVVLPRGYRIDWERYDNAAPGKSYTELSRPGVAGGVAQAATTGPSASRAVPSPRSDQGVELVRPGVSR